MAYKNWLAINAKMLHQSLGLETLSELNLKVFDDKFLSTAGAVRRLGGIAEFLNAKVKLVNVALRTCASDYAGYQNIKMPKW